jgi:hypothetical protein
MTGSREALTSLDETVRGAVRFGDGSKVEIRGLGAVMVSGKNQSSDRGILYSIIEMQYH